MNGSKKKPRQRNRPRNKANRAKDLPEKQGTKEDITLEKVMEHCNNVNRDSDCEKECEFLAATTTQNAAIARLQKLMREKLLEQEEPQQTEQRPLQPSDNKDTAREQKKMMITHDRNVKKSGNGVATSGGHLKHSKSKEKIECGKLSEKDVFIANLEKKMDSAIANGSTDLPNSLLENLQKLLNQRPLNDVETSDDDEEYVEYVYKPRKYFIYSICNFCKCDLTAIEAFPCSRCNMTYYCKPEHMKCDAPHRQLCYALQQVADNCGGHIFYKCGDYTSEEFRSYRIVNIRRVESIVNRPLTAIEKEILLFPRLCSHVKCREYQAKKLVDCPKCGQVAYCHDNPTHLSPSHQAWCKSFQLFKQMIIMQEYQGHIDPPLPTKILKDLPDTCLNTQQIFNKMSCDIHDPCEYAALSQIATCPLTAWYGLKLNGHLKNLLVVTIHLIGAEIEFEVDVLQKWELFFLHITPSVKELNVVFVGPELNSGNISFEQLKKISCCRSCRKLQRNVKYHFQHQLYHDYCKSSNFIAPNIICFFNAGLYRYNGFQMEDTWPETIAAAANFKCPVIVTAYTEYECPQDMARFVQECNRSLNVVLPPTKNPFASEKPERNFISDEEAPLMFKNYYCFLVE